MQHQMIYFLIAVFNEEQDIEKRIQSISSVMSEYFSNSHYKHKIVVVSDGSTDGTVAILKRLAQQTDLIFIEQKINRGPGAAFREGLRHLNSILNPEDIIITLDGDNTHNVKTIQFMINKIDDGYEVVSASGWATGGRLINLPFSRLILTKGCNWLYSVLFPIRGLTNYTGFFKAFKGQVILAAFQNYGEQFIQSDGFGFMSEIIVKLRRMPVFCAEVPLLIRFDLRKGISKNRLKNTLFEHLGIIRSNMFQRRLF
jgi:dolichol-phosphate mannosyltransferase